MGDITIFIPQDHPGMYNGVIFQQHSRDLDTIQPVAARFHHTVLFLQMERKSASDDIGYTLKCFEVSVVEMAMPIVQLQQ